MPSEDVNQPGYVSYSNIDPTSALWRELLWRFPQLKTMIDQNNNLVISDPAFRSAVTAAAQAITTRKPAVGGDISAGDTSPIPRQTGASAPPPASPADIGAYRRIDPSNWGFGALLEELRAEAADPTTRGLYTAGSLANLLGPYAQNNAIAALFENIVPLGNLLGTTAPEIGQINAASDSPEAKRPGISGKYSQWFNALDALRDWANRTATSLGGHDAYEGLSWLQNLGNIGSERPKTAEDWREYQDRVSRLGQTGAFGQLGEQMASWFLPQFTKVNLSSVNRSNPYSASSNNWFT